MNMKILSLLKHIVGSSNQYIARKSLIRQLESLSDHELKDAGLFRASIPAYVQKIYSDEKPAEIKKYNDDIAASPKHLVRDECCYC